MICNTNYHLYCVHKALDKSSNKKVKCKRCPDEYLPTTLYKPKVPEQSFNRKRSRYTQSDSESESDGMNSKYNPEMKKTKASV